MTNDTVLRTDMLSKRFGRRWALRDCTMELPRGRITALVGPNAAGKTTLLKLATGLIAPTGGTITTLGVTPGSHGTPAGLSFMAQEKPLYRTFRVAEMLRAGAVLNAGARWDGAYAKQLVDDASVASDARISTLSGGQRSRVALALALGRRPDLLLVDEPLSDLDPLARRQVMSTLLAEVVETGMTVLMASHVIPELEGVCDHLLLMRGGRVELAGDIDDLLADHHLVTGLADGPVPGRVVHERQSGRHRLALVRGPVEGVPGFVVAQPTLEELVIGHLEAPAEHAESGVFA